MNILVIGSGGREHALCWKIKQSPYATRIFCAPGNGGIASIAECVDIQVDNIPALLKFAQERHIDLTVVGPEVPLTMGIVDVFELAGLKIFGPSKSAAQLEGSKVFAKEFMHRQKIPTAKYCSYHDFETAVTGLKDFALPVVVKADGLAAGKGVIICPTLPEAEAALKTILVDHAFKEAGARVVVEEFLVGEEASILAVADGRDFLLLESAQDHKRIFDNDQGPNTGGMGAYSPAPIVTPELMKEISSGIIRPVIDGMAREGTPFKGVLYAGIMVTPDGPKVLEFNTRFGDPETQAILPRFKGDLLVLLLSAAGDRLAGTSLKWERSSCVCVVMAAAGYPGDYKKGQEITGLEKVGNGAVVFHAGTKKDGDRIVTSGGRVLGITSWGKDIGEAITNVYGAVAKVTFEGCYYRKDIGHRALKRG